MTHPASILFSSLLHAWVSMVSINLCNPCDQGRVGITIENMYFHAGNKLKEFISSLSCIHFYMFAKFAQINNKCGIWNCMFGLRCLLVWYINQWIVDLSTWEDGSELNKLSFLLDAPCSSWEVSYPIWCTLTFPLNVLGRVPIGLICSTNGKRVWRILICKIPRKSM